jgi:2-polyprenyl-3-methyl-5-hydroxy-6-metoxy-1,4-benzoquinol methylase
VSQPSTAPSALDAPAPPPSSPEMFEAYYDRLWMNLGAGLHYTEVMRVEFVVEQLRGRVKGAKVKILDYGCGRGWMAPYLAQFGKVVGMDYSPAGIAFARTKYGEYADFHLGDATKPTFGPTAETFDVIVCSEVLEHIEDVQKAIVDLRQLLSPGGLLLITTPNGNVWDRFASDRRFVHALQPIERWIRPSRLSQLLRTANFKMLLHEGRPMNAFRVGRTALMQRYWLFRAARFVALGSHFGRYILGDALYQVVVAERGADV